MALAGVCAGLRPVTRIPRIFFVVATGTTRDAVYGTQRKAAERGVSVHGCALTLTDAMAAHLHVPLSNAADANIGVIVVMFLVLALLFVYLCFKLRRRLLSVFKAVNSVLAVSAARKILIATVVCVVCFLVRSIFWLYEPITDSTLGSADKYLYPWLYYNVPELVPGVAMMLLIAPSTTASRKGPPDAGRDRRAATNMNAGAGIGGRKTCCWWCGGGAQQQKDVGFGAHRYKTSNSGGVEVHNPAVGHANAI